MIKIVFSSLIGFFNILFALILWFAFIFLKLDNMALEDFTEGERTLGRSIQHTWDVMMVDNEYHFRTAIGWFTKWISTIFLVIIMLNLLISVVSDAYDRI